MKPVHLHCDYLVIGAGLMGIGFIDTLMKKNRHATFVLVDKNDQPGGHWNFAYSWVRLHVPKCWYGVESKKLASEEGIKMNDRSSKAELLQYFRKVVDDMIASGRVRFLPRCEYQGENKVCSLVSSLTYTIDCTKLVDATVTESHVPSNTKPKFDLSPSVNFGPINDLSTIARPFEKYVILGAGKTGTDALFWLLTQGVAPDNITWVVSNDCWYIRRECIAPCNFVKFLNATWKSFAASSQEEFFLNWEKEGIIFRIDQSTMPTKFRAANLGEDEFKFIRCSIKNILRLGRVREITADQIILDRGSIPLTSSTFCVDCTAGGLPGGEPMPIFQTGKIVLQPTQMINHSLSCAMIALVEAFSTNDERKNQILMPAHSPSDMSTYLAGVYYTVTNLRALMKHPKIYMEVDNSRMNMFKHARKTPSVAFGSLWSMWKSMRPAYSKFVRSMHDGKFGVAVHRHPVHGGVVLSSAQKHAKHSTGPLNA